MLRPFSLAFLPLVLAACAMVPTGRRPEDVLHDPNARIVSSGFDAWRDKALVEQDRRDAENVAKYRLKAAEARNQAPFGWGLSLAQFDGPARLSRARQVAGQAEVKKPVFAESNGVTELFTGHYAKADDPEGVAALAKWRRLEINGNHPFAAAAMRALPTGKTPADTALDANAYSGYETLMVAFYNADFGPGWQEEAERVAKLLRREGPDGQGPVEAYFRHGEKESVVLVGLFTKRDDWRKKRVEGKDFFLDAPGPDIEAMQLRFPCLLRNNKKIPLGGDGATLGGGFEPTQLVDLK